MLLAGITQVPRTIYDTLWTMDGRISGRTWVGGWIDGQMHEQVSTYMDGLVNEMNRRMGP